MYCYHCGKKIDENKIESKKSSFAIDAEICENTTVSYVCPQCGHLIFKDGNEEDMKSLSRAAHAQLQRGSNDFALGMSFLSVGIIILLIAVCFYILACKPTNQHQLVVNCTEFYVFVVLSVISVILLVFGVFYGIRGFFKKRQYASLLKDLNNKTFVQ